MRGKLWALLLLSACLNPMPEEFPSSEGDSAEEASAPGLSGNSDGDQNNQPLGPDRGVSGGLVDDANEDENGTPLPPSINDGELAPDAGADAGTLSIEATGSEGETVP